MKLIFARSAWDDYLHWQASDANTLERINDLIGEIEGRLFGRDRLQGHRFLRLRPGDWPAGA